MASLHKGRWLGLSPARKMVVELLRHASKVPSMPLSAEFDLGALAAARKQAAAPPSWLAIFIRAYALAARRHPELRRALMPWPWKHLYEHPFSECVLPIEREWQGEQIILGAKIRAPEETSLDAIDQHLRYFKTAPVLQVSSFRQVLRFGRLPGFLRRFAFWQSLYLSGAKRAKRFGTFVISSLGNLGVEQHHPLTPLATYFTFGPVSAAGEVTAKIIYDHRVMDGRCVARCLKDLEEILLTDLLGEVRSPGSRAA